MQTFEIQLSDTEIELLSTNNQLNKAMKEEILSMLAEIALAAIPELAINPSDLAE